MEGPSWWKFSWSRRKNKTRQQKTETSVTCQLFLAHGKVNTPLFLKQYCCDKSNRYQHGLKHNQRRPVFIITDTGMNSGVRLVPIYTVLIFYPRLLVKWWSNDAKWRIRNHNTEELTCSLALILLSTCFSSNFSFIWRSPGPGEIGGQDVASRTQLSCTWKCKSQIYVYGLQDRSGIKTRWEYQSSCVLYTNTLKSHLKINPINLK